MNNVTSPNHYSFGNIECIDAIKSSMTNEEFIGFLKGNCIKYLWRFEHKNGLEDLKKANKYIEWLIKTAEQDTKPNNDVITITDKEEIPRETIEFNMDYPNS